ncbi:MAG TPA: hypothetical protein VKD45_04475, partial [Hyphomicrobiaceae bacterium]|nr:hypothetical protein [Hyphomicrobiaceae bacterium]
MEVVALSELEGTPMMAAPSRAAAAATAKKAVFKFTGFISVGLQGHWRGSEGAFSPCQRQRARYRDRTE